MNEGEGKHFEQSAEEPTMTEIIQALPDNFIAYCWQLFIKRITEHKGISEEGAKKIMLEQILEFAQHPEKIPHNPPQVYSLKEEKASIPLCKKELIQYIQGTFDLAKSHLSKYYEELQFFSPPELTPEIIEALEQKIQAALIFIDRIYKNYTELYEKDPGKAKNFEDLYNQIQKTHFTIIDFQTSKKATNGKECLIQIKQIDRSLSLLEKADKTFKKLNPY